MVGRRKGNYKREWVAKTVGIAVTRRLKKHTNTRIHYSINHFHTSHFVDSHSYHQVVAETEYRMSRKWIGSRCRRKSCSSHYCKWSVLDQHWERTREQQRDDRLPRTRSQIDCNNYRPNKCIRLSHRKNRQGRFGVAPVERIQLGRKILWVFE